MFTGLIQAVGKVASFGKRGKGARIQIRAAFADGSVSLGESVAVDGACLTVVRLVPGGFEADLSVETLRRTATCAWRPGRRVNLERALTPASRLGGHLVQGHVDAAGRVLAVSRGRGQRTLRVEIPGAIRPLVAEKGSIAVDGVSLTVSTLGRDWFDAALIPLTLAATNLSDRKRGDLVNLEADLIARHVARLFSVMRRVHN